MGQYHEYQSLLGDTSVLHLAVSEEKKQYLTASPGLLSGIIKLVTYKDNVLALPPRQGVRRYLSEVMVRITDVKCLVHLVTPYYSKEFF